MLTQYEFLGFKQDYPIYSKSTSTDTYGNEQYSYGTTPSGSLHVMWQPVTDEASIAQYGERVNKMKQCVLYENTAIDTYDRVVIGTDYYTVVSIMPFNTHRLVKVEKV